MRRTAGGRPAGRTGRRNRVRPDGELIAVPDRGLYWGNRGQLLDRSGSLARYSQVRAWITCELDFKGRRRTQWQPGRLTELYFLDEPTALAAGHRPCGECRSHDYRAFKAAWARAHPADAAGVAHLDARLHDDRLISPGVRRTFSAPAAELPDGTVFRAGGDFWLVRGDRVHGWGPGGYATHWPRGDFDVVTVVTPRSTVAALRAGYAPHYHPTATG